MQENNYFNIDNSYYLLNDDNNSDNEKEPPKRNLTQRIIESFTQSSMQRGGRRGRRSGRNTTKAAPPKKSGRGKSKTVAVLAPKPTTTIEPQLLNVTPNSEWTLCSKEKETCQLDSDKTTKIKYGNGSKWNYLEKSGIEEIQCDNATFGDPYPGQRKECYTLVVGENNEDLLDIEIKDLYIYKADWKFDPNQKYSNGKYEHAKKTRPSSGKNVWRTNKSGTHCNAGGKTCPRGWTEFSKRTGKQCNNLGGKCCALVCTGNNKWSVRHCWKENEFRVEIGSATDWDDQLKIFAYKKTITKKPSGCEKDPRLSARCTANFKINAKTASHTLVRILHKHMTDGRLSVESYDKFMKMYLFQDKTENCEIDINTTEPYERCPNYFSKDVSDIMPIIQEWRKSRESIWAEYVDEYCINENNMNEPFCECIGAKYNQSKFNDDYKLASKMGGGVQCFFLPCQQSDKFKYVKYDDTSNCVGLSCASFIEVKDEANLENVNMEQNINCEGPVNNPPPPASSIPYDDSWNTSNDDDDNNYMENDDDEEENDEEEKDDNKENDIVSTFLNTQRYQYIAIGVVFSILLLLTRTIK